MESNNWPSSMIYNLPMGNVEKAFYFILNTLVATMGIAINVFLCHAIWKFKKLKSISYLFIFVKSVFDICVSILQLPLQITPILPQPTKLDAKTIIIQFLSQFFGQVSVYMIIIIVIDRYFHMKYLTRYNMYLNRKKAWFFIIINITLNSVVSAMIILAGVFRFYFHFKIILALSYIFGTLLLMDGTMRIYRVVKGQQKELKLGNNLNNDDTTTSANQSHSGDKLVKAIGSATVCILTCYFPINVMQLTRAILNISGKSDQLVCRVLPWLYLVAYLNTSLHAVVFIAHNKQMKQHALSLFRKNVVHAVNNTNQQANINVIT
eukprot:gene11157-12329_t